MSENHPSYLALDRASLGQPTANLRAHIDGCSACREYLVSLRTPPGEAELSAIYERIAKRASPARASGWAWLGGGAAAAVALVLLVVLNPQPTMPVERPYVGVKGSSSVWIYVRRGAETTLWNGQSPLFAGDRLRLKVNPGQLQRVEVYSTKDPSAPELLYAGKLTPGESMTLPDAWEVDTEPGDERLLLVFSNEPVKPIWSEWLRGKAQPGVMLLPFVLPKSPLPAPSPGSTNP